MDIQIEQLLCKHCGPIVAAALEVERTQQAAKLARERLRALGVNTGASADKPEPIVSSAFTHPKERKPTTVAADPFKGKRGSRWRDVPVVQVLRNIRGDIAPNDLCDKLGIATSVLRDRVKQIIGQPDAGKRWQKDVGYVIKGKPAWDHERNTLRVDKTKGAAMAAFTETAKKPHKLTGKPASKPSRSKLPGPTDEELHAHVAGKLSVDKLARKYKCAPSTIYRAINFYKVRFGADAPHGEPKSSNDAAATSAGSNGMKTLPNGVKPPPVLDMARIVGN